MRIDDRSASAAAPHPSGRARLPASTRPAWMLVVAVTLGAALLPAAAEGSPDDPGRPANTASADESSIFDDLSATEVIEVLADDSFSFDGTHIVVEDPAPFGPFDDGGEVEARATGSRDSDADGPVSTVGFAEAFTLHSRPGATRKILLDFDGQTVTGTAWNTSSAPIEAGRYRRESATNPDLGFTQHDLDGIVEIWERVSEDFAAWDVDVTTEDPGAAALSKSSPDDDEYGIRTIVTTDYEWYDSRRFGGVAYLRSFARNSDLPAWVFSSNLGNGSPKPVAEAVSHEVGHTLGLRHDGIENSTTSSAYYSGHGSWAPIMGAGYSKPITQWSLGDYPGATNTEDDLYIIDGYLDRRSAASGGSISTLPSGGPSVTEHVLEQSGATNVHSLAVTSGPVTVIVDKLDAAGNLLADLTIRDSFDRVVASSSPLHPATWSLNATLPADVDPGLYTVEVRSTGWPGSGAADPGFSSYGSIGAYAVSVEMPTSDPTGPTTTTPGSTVPQNPPTTTDAPSPTTPSTPPSDPPSTTPSTPPSDPPSTPPSTPPSDPPSTPPPAPEPGGDRLTPISPIRVLDTRTSASPTNGRVRAGQNLRLDLPTAPSGTTATIVNVVAADAADAGWLSLTPCNEVAPNERTSSLNFTRRGNTANSVIVPLTSRGEMCVYAAAATHVVVDVTGWIGPDGSLTLDELGSQRVVDSRDRLGFSGPLLAATTYEIDLSGVLSGGDIAAVAVNITAVRPSARGYLTIDDCSGRAGQTSTLNVDAGAVRGNNGIFALGTGQRLCVFTTTTTHLTIDITGEFGTGAGLRFVPAAPERVLDTRVRQPLDPGASTAFDVPSPSPDNALSTTPGAASVNLTAARPRSGGFVTAWDCGPRPATSALNPMADASTANGALVPLSPAGRTCLFHSAGGHLIVDLSGWWI